MATDQSINDSQSLSDIGADGASAAVPVTTGPPKNSPKQSPAGAEAESSEDEGDESAENGAATADKKADAKSKTKAKEKEKAEAKPAPKPSKKDKKKEAAEKEEEDEAYEERERGLVGNLLFSIKEWFVTQGVWWAASTVGHALVLTTTLLILGTAAGMNKIHSVAPAFESVAGVNTEVGEPPDIDSFDMHNTSRIDPSELSNNATAAVDAPTLRAGGDHAGTGDGAAGGGGGGGSGAVSSTGAVGSGPGGGGGGGLGGMGGIAGMDIASAIPSFGHGSKIGEGGGRRRSSPTMGGIGQAGDVGGAVDGLISGIRRELEAGDLLVVWLVDASISLIDDRQKVAERIEPFFYEIERRGKGHYKLQNAVVAFGQTAVEVVAPTNYSPKITQAIRELPVDPSGLENVMTSVEMCMDQYGKKWKGGMMIVVWTDESGNDILRLEETIYRCRQRNTVVNVVGPTAVLGSERGRHHYVDKGTGLAFLLPIFRGPDTCLPERLFLPYWWDSPLAPWIQDGVVAAHGVPWYGGPHREGILSGVGPYALTRLALQTGGQFILLDRKEDKSPYTFETMKKYLPDYNAASEYMKSLAQHPLRKVTSDAVQATYSVANLWPPSTQFILIRDTHYPFGIHGHYYTPVQFRNLLKEELPKQLAHANAAADVIEQALKHFPEAGMESEYAGERSPRWRAWYDLTRGRLLAMSIRTLEYKLACEKVWQPGFLAPETNRINFLPVSEYLSGTVSESRAREAFRLLTRLKTENKGTPWEMLADWELKHELGITIKQIVIPPPKPGPSPPRPPAPVIKFPTL